MYGYTALMAAASESTPGNIAKVQMLLAAGARQDLTISKCHTPEDGKTARDIAAPDMAAILDGWRAAPSANHTGPTT